MYMDINVKLGRDYLFKDNPSPEDLLLARGNFLKALLSAEKRTDANDEKSDALLFLALTIKKSNFSQPGDIKKYEKYLKMSAELGNNRAKFHLAVHFYENGMKAGQNRNPRLGMIYFKDFLTLAHELLSLPKKESWIPMGEYGIFASIVQRTENRIENDIPTKRKLIRSLVYA